MLNKNSNKRENSFHIYAGILILFVLTVMVRVVSTPHMNPDTDGYLKWYDYIARRGLEALEDDFSIYTPPYSYLLWIARYFKDSIPAEIAIKLIPLPFDVLSAFVVYKIARIRLAGKESVLAAAGFLCLPTVMANSSLWGQIDSIYTSFLLLSFYFILKRESFWAVILFGISFSIKAQAIFFLPFLIVLLLQKRIRLYYFLLVPVVYFITILPAMYAGRSAASLFTIYMNQAGEFEEIAKTAPNPYIFIPQQYYHPALEIGLTVSVLFIMYWIWANRKSSPVFYHSQLALAALTSLSLAPFLLPKMHDRYFYPADVFSYATALLDPKLWFLPILFQLSSGLSYTIFLFDAPAGFVYAAAIINSSLIIYITYKQIQSRYPDTQE